MLETLQGFASYLAFFAVFASFFALLSLGLNIQWGMAGLFNVGVAGFALIGAYGSAILTTPDHPAQIGGFGLPVAAGWLGAMVLSGLFALLVGLPALRLRHDYLAITTFGIAVTVQLVALNAQVLTGGAFGISFIPRPLYEPIGGGVAWNLAYLGLVLAIVGAVYLASERMARGPWGRVLRAIREDEAAATALGKHSKRFRLEAFVLGAMVMGLAGAIYAHFVGFIAPEDFLPILTFQVWTMLIVGGSGNNRGAVAGALVVWAIWTASGAMLHAIVPAEFQVRASSLQTVAIGVALAVVLLLRPRGLLGEEITVSRHAGPD